MGVSNIESRNCICQIAPRLSCGRLLFNACACLTAREAYKTLKFRPRRLWSPRRWLQLTKGTVLLGVSDMESRHHILNNAPRLSCGRLVFNASPCMTACKADRTLKVCPRRLWDTPRWFGPTKGVYSTLGGLEHWKPEPHLQECATVEPSGGLSLLIPHFWPFASEIKIKLSARRVYVTHDHSQDPPGIVFETWGAQSWGGSRYWTAGMPHSSSRGRPFLEFLALITVPELHKLFIFCPPCAWDSRQHPGSSRCGMLILGVSSLRWKPVLDRRYAPQFKWRAAFFRAFTIDNCS